MKFEDAVEQYTTYLLKLSYLYVKDKQVAEDIVQDTFVKLYAQFGNVIEVEKVKSYIVTTAVNRCRDYFRSWHYKKVQLSELCSCPYASSTYVFRDAHSCNFYNY